MSYRAYYQATYSEIAASENFDKPPRVHSKGLVLRVILASRVSYPKPARQLEPAIYSFLGGLREKKVFCPGNSIPRFGPGSSCIDFRPAK